jgi:hypothetical protein
MLEYWNVGMLEEKEGMPEGREVGILGKDQSRKLSVVFFFIQHSNTPFFRMTLCSSITWVSLVLKEVNQW